MCCFKVNLDQVNLLMQLQQYRQTQSDQHRQLMLILSFLLHSWLILPFLVQWPIHLIYHLDQQRHHVPWMFLFLHSVQLRMMALMIMLLIVVVLVLLYLYNKYIRFMGEKGRMDCERMNWSFFFFKVHTVPYAINNATNRTIPNNIYLFLNLV